MRKSVIVSDVLFIIMVLGCFTILIFGCFEPGRTKIPQVPIEDGDRFSVQMPGKQMRWQGEMAGEVTGTSVILQARLNKNGKVRWFDVKGKPGIGAFVISLHEDFRDKFRTPWSVAWSDNDFLIKQCVKNLESGTRYYYRLISGTNTDDLAAGPVGTFRTIDGRGSREYSLVVVTGMNYFAFYFDRNVTEKHLGFPALETITKLEPDFVVGTGDNVYYDTPYINRAKDLGSMRARWHTQFATPRFEKLFLQVPWYWEKDDHDHRYNDCDPHFDVKPSNELGIEVFKEQVPVTDPADKNAVTYRTYKLNDLIQIWFTEGRDYRDSNIKPPGPDKTMWGHKQRNWLIKTLLKSDATFKILISPTPMVGPDDTMTGVQGGKILSRLIGGAVPGQEADNRKRDNHTNEFGFRDEANWFFKWLSDNGFHDKNFYLVCGDRHWQYHSIHPSGFEEFSCGALVDGNARLGNKPGDPDSTDSDGLIKQPYTQDEKSGGFLKVGVHSAKNEGAAMAKFTFFDEHGKILYEATKRAK